MRPESLLSEAALASLAEHAREAPPGPFVEVGVYKGGSAAVLYEIAREQDRQLWLFDTFTGMPFADEIDGNEAGSFADTSFREICRLFPKAYPMAGIFPDETWRAVAATIEPVAFVHADADQYRSTKGICDCLPPVMAAGGMILFDDYGLPGCDGCTRAVDEADFANREILPTGKLLVRF